MFRVSSAYLRSVLRSATAADFPMYLPTYLPMYLPTYLPIGNRRTSDRQRHRETRRPRRSRGIPGSPTQYARSRVACIVLAVPTCMPQHTPEPGNSRTSTSPPPPPSPAPAPAPLAEVVKSERRLQGIPAPLHGNERSAPSTQQPSRAVQRRGLGLLDPSSPSRDRPGPEQEWLST
ncbi:hypothetical protein BASA81_017966 [Batrachochytrium salamandrivorans]|nr:hypothetical protein BASA81_017966 [Batrachochytrium salamandrivorans]